MNKEKEAQANDWESDTSDKILLEFQKVELKWIETKYFENIWL